MKKNLNKKSIALATLEMLKNKSDLKEINFREISRYLNCSHTNLYNYFNSYNALLWEAHTELQYIFLEYLEHKISAVNFGELELRVIINAFLDFYLENKGWFKLAWILYIEGERPLNNIQATEYVFKKLVGYVSNISESKNKTRFDINIMDEIVHNTHCYIIGEVSNYIFGRGIIKEEKLFKEYVANFSEKILNTFLK
jgi:hypothetical protein